MWLHEMPIGALVFWRGIHVGYNGVPWPWRSGIVLIDNPNWPCRQCISVTTKLMRSSSVLTGRHRPLTFWGIDLNGEPDAIREVMQSGRQFSPVHHLPCQLA